MTDLSYEAQRRLHVAMANKGLAQEVIDILNAVDIASAAELGYIDGVTAGTGAASKAVVLDADGEVALPDSAAIHFGADEDVTLVHDGTDGLTVGSASTEKIAFWGATPAAQQSHVADPAAMASTTQGTYTASTTLTDPPTKAEAEAELALIDAELDKVKVDVAAAKTAIDANNASIDSILASLEALGLHAAS